MRRKVPVPILWLEIVAVLLRLPAAVLAASGSTGGTASLEPSASERAAGEDEVLIDGARFKPAELTVAAGTGVVFVNEEGYGHTVAEGSRGAPSRMPSWIPRSPPTRPSGSSSTSPEPSTFTCIFHPTMQLTITVED